MKLSRRMFIKGSVLAVTGLRHADALAASRAADLVEVAGADPGAMVAAAFDALGGISTIVHPGDRVVLKPNAAFANPPAWGTTTHPDVVAAVAKQCLDARAKQVTIVEYPQARADKCLERCGLRAAMAALPQVQVKLLSGEADFQKVDVKGGVSLKATAVAKAVLSADVLINIPTAKAHNRTGVSFGLKNHMGLIFDRQSLHTSLDLDQAVADLGRIIKPQLTLLDATRALLTNGPAGPGEIATPNKIVAGRSVVSVDAYGLTLARFNQKQMTLSEAKHIELAGKAGLGETDVQKLKVKKIAL